MTHLIPPIAFLLFTVGAFISAAMCVRHAYGMLKGTNPASEGVSQLVPFFYFAFPGTLDEKGQKHRSRLFIWLTLTAALAGAAALIQALFHP